MPSTHPARLKFLDRVNYYGQLSEFDTQGRVLVPPRLRDAAGMSGEVDVLGQVDYLEVWNHERFLAKLQREPFTDDDARALSEFGI
jgi:MraZ protein